MELICPICKKIFIFKWWPSHLKRAKSHYCWTTCQWVWNNIIQWNRLHWLCWSKEYRIWCNVKKRAKIKWTEFTLEPEDIPELLEFCPVLWIKIDYSKKIWPHDNSPSLDRINPKKWYIKWNVRIISNRANRLKSDSSIDEIRLILKDAETLYHNNNDENI